MNRRESREHVMKLLFQKEFYDKEEHDNQLTYYFERFNIKEENQGFILKEYKGTVDHEEEIDEIISKNSKNWKIARMARLDLTILRLATYEIYYEDDIPSSVSINEAVEIAQIYSSDEAPKFINGVLANVFKEKKV